jgi:hypothetical protein
VAPLDETVPFGAYGDSGSMVFCREGDNVTFLLGIHFRRDTVGNTSFSTFLCLEAYSQVAATMGMSLDFNRHRLVGRSAWSWHARTPANWK